ncbi:MAG: hypothetical protein MUE53_04195 [Chitinophagales bacterium]|jgi:hypothetical protein|nr:hypothetical protein [Chitinophagales bacterium]
MKTTLFLSLLFVSFFTVSSCTKTEEKDHDHDVITKVTMNFTNSTDPKDIVVWSFEDKDGDGGNAPEFSTSPLKTNINYNLSLKLYNTSETPVEEKTAEIKEDAEAHQFFHIITPTASHSYKDEDKNKKPLGLDNSVIFTKSGTYSYRLVLRHNPNKSATGVSTGDITNAEGTSDIDITFSNVSIQ